MKAFIDEHFLLSTQTARSLYHETAAGLPIIDYHCHVSPRDIAENRRFDSITQLWLGGDHYKWRIMRANGTPERDITGDGDDYAKFLAFAAALEKAAGNPLYHWTHLELRRYFDYDGVLSRRTAPEVYALCNRRLREADDFSVRALITRSNVELLCTTDDPSDSLEYHDQLAADPSFSVQVRPAFRPDGAVHVEKPGFAAAVSALSRASGVAIHDFDTLCQALSARLDFFAARGCRLSDHALECCVYARTDVPTLNRAITKAMDKEALTQWEAESFQTEMLLFLGREYARRGWVMQLHFGSMRDVSSRMAQRLGPDTGFDCINSRTRPERLAPFLNALEEENALPQMILYSLNPHDNAVIASVISCFQNGDDGKPGKLQHGSAWWFNDTKAGMLAQMTNLADMGLLGNFLGMLTDSRSFLSYVRHEYFRRILCDLLGSWVENGEFPYDRDTLNGMVEDICYRNARRYFGFQNG